MSLSLLAVRQHEASSSSIESKCLIQESELAREHIISGKAKVLSWKA
jgi:hypothetical protein